MKIRKAFTLLELMVVIGVTAIVLACVGASLLFVVEVNETATTSTSLLYKLTTLKDYILDNQIVDGSFNYNQDSRVLSYQKVGEEPIDLIVDIDTVSVDITTKDIDEVSGPDFYYCTITYLDSGNTKTIEFVVKEYVNEGD